MVLNEKIVFNFFNAYKIIIAAILNKAVMFSWQKQRTIRNTEVAVCQRSYDNFPNNTTKEF